MKTAARNVKTKDGKRLPKQNLHTKSKREIKSESNTENMVSFLRVTQKVIGFRECSKLIQIANETDTIIKLISGKKQGTTESILSLVTLGLSAGTSIVLEIDGRSEFADKHTAFHSALEVITKGCSDPQ